MTSRTEPSIPTSSEFVAKNEWMIRPSSEYESEYKECSSIKARINQYFIFGKPIDCSNWKRNSINAAKWEDSKDEKAAVEVITNEQQRRKERLMSQINNDVWEKRSSPPENWNAPLPDYILQNYKNSYLHFKAMEWRGEASRTTDFTAPSLCTIL
ncbi:UPF0545 protein C22orf39 homolog [Coccinella septempunctata]|uniref:UPF0545 protein C22orf39 homolog n=1 Tax=Coccinella septempunctata TaxID=41139 RepID=UPI001D06729D|nr:UPF0545 protein C22orf39 homolog [Coccinella septempunctata]